LAILAIGKPVAFDARPRSAIPAGHLDHGDLAVSGLTANWTLEPLVRPDRPDHRDAWSRRSW
jgi:hypothetical protein